jgi:HAD superfamily hydrolase (TIGR01549 family)
MTGAPERVSAPAFSADGWSSVRLVVFDVDGTLYAQRPVRLAMARSLLLHGLTRGGWKDVKALARFRRLREEAGGRALVDFEPQLLAEAAETTGYAPERLAALAEEWLDRRPLPLLRRARYDGVDALFDALRRSRRRIAVWSDHPVRAKLAALGLDADDAAGAADRGLGRLKPDPEGLQLLMRRAGTEPSQTLMIGDRADRDGEAARRAGVRCLLRSGRPLHGWSTFARYDDPVFAPVLRDAEPRAAA